MAILAPNAPTAPPPLPRVPRTTRRVPPNPRSNCPRLYLPDRIKFRAVALTFRPSKAPQAPQLFRLLCRPNVVRPILVVDSVAMRPRRSPQIRSPSRRPTRTFRSLTPRTASIPHRALLVPRHPTRISAGGTSAHVVSSAPLPLIVQTVGPRLNDPWIPPRIGEMVGSVDGQRDGNCFCGLRGAFFLSPRRIRPAHVLHISFGPAYFWVSPPL